MYNFPPPINLSFFILIPIGIYHHSACMRLTVRYRPLFIWHHWSRFCLHKFKEFLLIVPANSMIPISLSCISYSIMATTKYWRGRKGDITSKYRHSKGIKAITSNIKVATQTRGKCCAWADPSTFLWWIGRRRRPVTKIRVDLHIDTILETYNVLSPIYEYSVQYYVGQTMKNILWDIAI